MINGDGSEKKRTASMATPSLRQTLTDVKTGQTEESADVAELPPGDTAISESGSTPPSSSRSRGAPGHPRARGPGDSGVADPGRLALAHPLAPQRPVDPVP